MIENFKNDWVNLENEVENLAKALMNEDIAALEELLNKMRIKSVNQISLPI